MSELITAIAVWVIACVMFATMMGTAHAGPDPAPGARKHVTFVSYTFQQFDTTHVWVRTVHVPAHGKRWCGPWRVA